MAWRYYAQRATTGDWLDTNVQLSSPLLSWVLSAPDNGRAILPHGIGNPKAEDGRPVFGKWDTLLLAEEDRKLQWFGICTEAVPTKEGTGLEFIGLPGWLAGVPYEKEYRVWKTPLWEVVKEILSEAKKIKDGLHFQSHFTGGEGWTIGDAKPPEPPKADKDKTAEQNAAAAEAWRENHGWKTPYELAWWASPMVGREIDSLAKEYGFDYAARIRWEDRGKLKYSLHMDFSNEMRTRREDIEFVDGINLAAPIDVKPGTDKYANRIIALGAGEGRDMLIAKAGNDDGRLYQASIVSYKAINQLQRLKDLAKADLKRHHANGVRVDTLVVWDMPGFAPISSLNVGDEVKIRSSNTVPTVNDWARVTSITRNPTESTAVVNFEVAE